MMKISSKSRVVMGIVFGMNGFMYLAYGKTMLAVVWLFCSAVHIIDAYRLHCQEKEEI